MAFFFLLGFKWDVMAAFWVTVTPLLITALLYLRYKEWITLRLTGMSDRWYKQYVFEKETALCPECGTPLNASQVFDSSTRQVDINDSCSVCGYGRKSDFKVERPNLMR